MSFLVIGDVSSTAMKPVRVCVEALVADGADARFAADVSQLSKGTSWDGWHPDLVIVCQHWSDEYGEADVQRLLVSFPLARLVCCYGLWCESDGRTRDVWPLSVRVPARCAAERIGRELEVIVGTRAPLPLTASRDEIFLFDAAGSIEDRLAFR